MRFDGIFCSRKSRLARSLSIQCCHDVNFARVRLRIVSLHNFGEALNSQLAGFYIRIMQHRHFTAGLAQQFDHRFASQFTALIIVCCDVADHFAFRPIVLDVVGEDRNASLVGFANGGSDCPRIARVQNYGRHALHDEVFHLRSLAIDILIARNNDHVVSTFCTFLCHGVGDDFEERIGQRQRRESNRLALL